MKRSTTTTEKHRSVAVRLPREWTLTRCLVLLGAVASLAGCAGADEVDPVAQGQALYETNCAMCHGEGALGDGPIASGLPVPPPGLFEHLGHHTRAHLIQLIATGIPPAMPPTALADDEIALVVDYLWTLVPEDQVAELRAMQEQMELMGDSAMEMMEGMDMGDGMDMDSIPGMDIEEHTMPMEMEDPQ